MKLRANFVSNSSSSSSIVIGASKGHIIPHWSGKLTVDDNFGRTDFGWGPETVWGTESLIIFCYLQATDVNNSEWLEMLEKVIKDNTDVTEIVWDKSLENGYIDHQSSAGEGENTEMFESEQTLKDFIFGESSRVILDNDNH